MREQITRIIAEPDVLGTLADRHVGRNSETLQTVHSLMQAISSLEETISRDASAFREQGFSGAALASALSPLRDEHARLTAELASMQRTMTRRPIGGEPKMRKRILTALKTNLAVADDTTMRTLLMTLGARIDVVGYRQCPTCGGTGYLKFAPGSARHAPNACRHCLKGRNPDLRIELDDVAALALAMRLGEDGALDAG